MYKDNITEVKKAILFFQLASIIESGEIDLTKDLHGIKDTNRDLVETLDKVYAIKNNTEILYNDAVCDLGYESLFESIEINKELSKMEDFLRIGAASVVSSGFDIPFWVCLECGATFSPLKDSETIDFTCPSCGSSNTIPQR